MKNYAMEILHGVSNTNDVDLASTITFYYVKNAMKSNGHFFF